MGERTNSKSAENSQYRIRRTEIVDIAASLFARNGYAATGIREISEAVGLDRGGLYYYIKSKESLLEDIHDRVLDPLLEETRKIAKLNFSATSRLRLISESLLQNIIEHQDHVWVFLHEYRAFTGVRRETFRQKRAEFETIISELFEEGMSDGEFNFNDLRFTVMAFIGTHNYTYLWVGHGHDVDPKRLSLAYCNIFFNGIAGSQSGESRVPFAEIVASS
ncbi:MAG: TetR/AcrR family transcriptional regulator [Acidimicrobiales bacterium]